MVDKYVLYLEDEQARNCQVAEELDNFIDLYLKRLWHQLTIAIEEGMELPKFHNDKGILPRLYNNFISGFGYRLNQLRLAKIAVCVSKNYSSEADAISFLEGVIKQVKETKQLRNEQPLLYLRLQIAKVKLDSGDTGGCKKIVQEGKDELEAMQNVDPDVSAAYYFNRSLLYKHQKDFAEFYKSSLLYLAFISSDALPQDIKLSLAVDISLAALLGDNIYNFGELLLHPLIKVLDGTPYMWLHIMLECFNNGDMHAYDQVCQQYADVLNGLPSLVENERKLREKITILALTELVFQLPAEKRTIPLQDIADRTKLDIDGVEFLLMKTLSLNLIKGTIDAVAQTVHVTWVQPRVLTKPQIAALKGRLEDWICKVKAGTETLEAESLVLAA